MRFGAHQRQAVPRQHQLRVELRHLAQRRRPLARIALRLLGVAGVGRGPDEQVAAAEDPCAGTQVQVWSSVSPFAWWSSKRSPPTSSVRLVGRSRRGRGTRRGTPARPAGTAGVDRAVVARRERVAREALRHVLVGHHVRRRPAALGRLRLEQRDAEDVVHVAVGVDRRVQGRGGPARSCSCTWWASMKPPVSTSTSPSPVSKALTFASEGTKAIPGDLGELAAEAHRMVVLYRLPPSQSRSASSSSSVIASRAPSFSLSSPLRGSVYQIPTRRVQVAGGVRLP